jgi:hypothetical protein
LKKNRRQPPKPMEIKKTALFFEKQRLEAAFPKQLCQKAKILTAVERQKDRPLYQDKKIGPGEILSRQPLFKRPAQVLRPT